MTLPAHTELLILGAGPAGLAAALAAGERQVTVIDDNLAPGGQIWRGGPGQWQDARAAAMWTALQQRPKVRIVSATRVVARPGPNTLLLENADGGHTLAWDRLILCSGARELLLPFPGWTLPGVTGAGGLQALVKGGMPVHGKRVLVAGTGPLLLAVAESLLASGAQVLAIAEHQGTPRLARFFAQLALSHPAKCVQALQLRRRLRRVPYLHGVTAIAAHGDTRLHSVVLRHGGRETRVECDFLACGYGLLPNTELAAMLGCALEQGRVVVDGQQRTSRADIWAAGEATGIGGVDKALAEGTVAGLFASGQSASAAQLQKRTRAASFGTLLACSFPPPEALRAVCTPDTVICRCEDVTAGQLAPFARWRDAKLQTRLGMGPCQGRVCGAACTFLYGWQADGLRQPVFPTSAATLAQGMRPQKKDNKK